jgi:hypothetical protein
MRTETKVITYYQFDELSETAKDKAVRSLFDINVDYHWWENITEHDAKQIGLEISEFDIDRGNRIKGQFIESAEDCANKILAEHGEKCQTYLTACEYIKDRSKLIEHYSDGITLDEVAEGNEDKFDEDCDQLDGEFLRSILEDYLILLRKEYEYLTSEEAIIDQLRLNEYEFDEDGNLL